MSYSACDFVNDAKQNCDTYGVPHVPPGTLEDCDPERCEVDALRLLAERVACGMAHRASLLSALRALLSVMEAPRSRKATEAWTYALKIAAPGGVTDLAAMDRGVRAALAKAGAE